MVLGLPLALGLAAHFDHLLQAGPFPCLIRLLTLCFA
jgi:hypothetical protein